jgi:lipoprotein-anchoring transpeptidase ErfK/SrfK
LLERIAERFHCAEQFLQALNSEVDFARAKAGQTLNVPNVLVSRPAEKANVVRIKLGRKVIIAYGDRDRIIGFFPCSIGKDKERRPVGELKVKTFAPNPNFTWDPAVFAESPESKTITSKLILPPGPNNPVGVYWIGLDRTGYGIHGTPKPEDIGKTESHGCFRLANWNVEALAKLLEIGTPVVIEP